MTTETSPLNRQPDQLDYSSPTQFRFILNQIPKVQFFVQTANIPGISLGEAVIPTLNSMGVSCIKIEKEEDVESTIKAALTMAFNSERPVAVVLSQKLIGAKIF